MKSASMRAMYGAEDAVTLLLSKCPSGHKVHEVQGMAKNHEVRGHEGRLELCSRNCEDATALVRGILIQCLASLAAPENVQQGSVKIQNQTWLKSIKET